MTRSILLIVGLFLLIVQQFFHAFTPVYQFSVFIAGIVFLGVPHGAADLLVATQNTVNADRDFSTILFFRNYLGQLFFSGIVLWFFPVTGIIFFVFLAAYHFGQTDFSELTVTGFSGKIFFVNYGLLVLGSILLNHFDEVRPFYHSLSLSIGQRSTLDFIDLNRAAILEIIAVGFVLSAICYMVMNYRECKAGAVLLLQLMLLVPLVYNMPMLLGFTFYFIVWHSLMSLTNIIRYLSRSGLFSNREIIRQICFYSLIALAGMFVAAFAGYLLIDNKTIVLYVILGLAVLTAPHMQVMNDMYASIFRLRPGQ